MRRTPMAIPIHLSDAQMSAIFAASHPLPPHRRGPFLEACAQELAQRSDIGDGTVFRIVSAMQKKFFDPPDFGVDNGASRSRRGRPRRDDDSEDDRPRRKAQPRTLGAL
jgi:hypothetical protein